ncbi:WYL domain-containing protein [Colwellia sp. Arc7-635]|uniref:helix-turn-helix transcriptional regulator n=1 Tax=Colwellia sp. Arc7-635 TaxID=2497879 RepID=UPI000F85756D|nr:WYL domain-containing protein [Colwellia sp. Arc7-635]AZQ83650.1 WYL domain-containing protein [Colwellia sp. Arc7-635]
MLSFQRRLDLLDHIPRYPNKITTRQLLDLLEANGHESLIIRKVQRDLEAIESMGMFGLEVDKRSKPYGWSINLNWKKLNISLMDANSALAFSTLKEVAGTLLPESTLDDLSPYFAKAEVIINNEKSPLISHWKNSVALINSNNPVSLPLPDKEALSQIKKAIFHKKQMSADLKRFLLVDKNPIWKRYQHINPLGLIQREYVVTLICSIGSFHQKIYKFPIAFIKDVQIDDADVKVPKHFNFEQTKNSYFRSNVSHKEISLSLLARKDSYFVMSNGKFNGNQVTIETENSELVKISATVEDNPKLRAFLRGLGSSIEVLEPSSLRTYFKELAQELLTKYQ